MSETRPTGATGAVPGGRGPGTGRVLGLDGLRGLAALFVVFHHSWLSTYPQFPAAAGPAWAGWMAYGHFAVALFIVLSGFSLAVSPARKDWKLGGNGRFARRRAWRILPPYWAALVFSLIVAWAIVPQPGEGTPTLKSVLSFGLLLQDVTGSPSPNGAFWSIAVEAQLYIFFPLLLLAFRRNRGGYALAGVLVAVATIGLLSPYSGAINDLNRFSLQLAVLFAAGAATAGVLRPGMPRLPWGFMTLAAGFPVLGLILVAGQRWTVTHLFWMDLAIGPFLVCLVAWIATGGPRRLIAFLDSRPLHTLGTCSYSLYLIHAPLVVVISEKIIGGSGVPHLLGVLALSVPVSLLTARLFAAVFEIPFTKYRSMPELRAAIEARRHPAAARPEPATAAATAAAATVGGATSGPE